MKTGSNPAVIPFSITPDAEEYLRHLLIEFPRQARPVLMRATFQSDGLNPPRWCHEGESFVLGDFDVSEEPKTDLVESELFGRRVAIEADALKRLSGGTLDLREVGSSRGIYNNKKFILVAEPSLNPAHHGSKPVTSPEELKRRFSIGAMTILGGFTGMGLTWIVSALVSVMIFRTSFEWLVSHLMPFLVAGWIAGAITSFYTFKYVFKTSGRTKLAQEKLQREFFGRVGPGDELNWWLFLGIPLPPTASLVLSVGRFIRTVEGKTGLVFVAIVVVFGTAMYICDRLPRRLVVRLGIFGWVLTFVLGFWYFKTYGP